MHYCPTCPDMERDVYSLIAPAGTRGRPGQWLGRLPRKPWAYRVTVVIPHLETVEPLKAAIATLRAQTIQPYFVIVDTGSSASTCDRLELLRSEDLEVHYIRSHGYIHPSEPVTVALDLGHALCRTDYLYHTHSDCFAMRRDWLQWLLARCDGEHPVIGYEMSERSGTREWIGTVSHTATMLHMPTMRRIGALWSMRAWYEARGVPGFEISAWPDTESMLRLCMDRHGITPTFVNDDICPGAKHERNYMRDTDVNVDHVRSYPSRMIYAAGTSGDAKRWMEDAIRQAWERVALWCIQ